MTAKSKTAAIAFALAVVGFGALGHLGLRGARAQPASRGAGAPSPPYVFRPGSAGFGYYRSPAPAAGAAASGSTSRSLTVPARGRGSSGARRGRDWSIGRRMTIAKPWLSPMD
jgi:hypothetical protein